MMDVAHDQPQQPTRRRRRAAERQRRTVGTTMRCATLAYRSACAFLLWSCAAQPAAPPLITDPNAVAAHDGELVTIRGVLRSLKWTMVLGVSVHDEPRSIDGAMVEATGVLKRWCVPAPASVWDSSATRYGTFFTLQDPQMQTRMARVALARSKKT